MKKNEPPVPPRTPDKAAQRSAALKRNLQRRKEAARRQAARPQRDDEAGDRD